MISFNSTQLPLQNSTGIILEKYIIVQAAAEISGYNTQYLQRLLRVGKLESVKIGQVWLIKIASLERYLEQAGQKKDQCCGPKSYLAGKSFTNVNTQRNQLYTPRKQEVTHE